MNRKISLFFIVFSLCLTATLVPTACTLYMDEEEQKPEELQGFDAPVHVKNDTVDVTYQFQPDTHYLTPHVQEYLVMVEADTILYFRDNTPIDYLPKTGEKVFSHSSDLLPWGMMGLVEWAGYTDGFYKVVTTDTTLGEVFKVLKLNVDRPTDYSKARLVAWPEDSDHIALSEEPSPFTMEPFEAYDVPDDALYEDDEEDNSDTFSDEEDNSDSFMARYDTGAQWQDYATRSDDDEVDGPHDEEDEMEYEIMFDTRRLSIVPKDEQLSSAYIFSLITNSKLPRAFQALAKTGLKARPAFLMGLNKKKGSKFKVKGKELGIDMFAKTYWALGFKIKNTERTHLTVDLSEEFFEYFVDDDSEVAFNIEAGVQAGGELQGGTERYYKPGKWMAGKKNLSSKTEAAQTLDGPEVAIPVWGPFCFLFTTSFDVSITFDLCGQISIVNATHARKGVRYMNGKAERIGDKSKKNTSKANINICGQAKAEFTAHLGVGVRLGVKVLSADATVGGYFTAGAEAKVGYALGDKDFDYERQPLDGNNYLSYYVKCGPEVNIKISFLGSELYKKNIPVGKVWTLTDGKIHPYPYVNSKAQKVVKTSNDNGEWDFSEQDFRMTQKFSSVGLLQKTFGYEFSPFVELQESGSGKHIGFYFPIEADSPYWPLQNDKNFTYTYDFTGLEPDVLYKAIPYVTHDGVNYVYPKDALYFTSATPNIVMVGDDVSPSIRQVEVDYDKNGDPIYTALATYQVLGASKMKKWGLKVTLKAPNGKTLINKDIECEKIRNKEYKVKLVFFTNAKKYCSLSLQPFGDVIDEKGNKKRKYFAKSNIVLEEDFTPTERDRQDRLTSDWNPYVH